MEITRPRARPRFTLDLAVPPSRVIECVRQQLARADGAVRGSAVRNTVLLTVSEKSTHFWSPHLDAQLTETDAGGTRIAAMFAPHPHIWTMFLGLQLLFGLLSMGALVWVATMLSMRESPWLATIVLAAMLFGGGFSYGAAYVGQGIGSEQMYELRAFLEDALRHEPRAGLAPDADAEEALVRGNSG